MAMIGASWSASTFKGGWGGGLRGRMCFGRLAIVVLARAGAEKGVIARINFNILKDRSKAGRRYPVAIRVEMNSAAATQKCLILDDDELEKPRTERSWRDIVVTAPVPTASAAAAAVPAALSTSRFSGLAPSGATTFPSAFQTYRPNREGVRRFPFQQGPTTSARPPRAPVAVKPRDLSGEELAFAPGQSLLGAVRTMIGLQISPILVGGAGEEPESYPYAPCTPPATEAPPGGFPPTTPPIYE